MTLEWPYYRLRWLQSRRAIWKEDSRPGTKLNFSTTNQWLSHGMVAILPNATPYLEGGSRRILSLREILLVDGVDEFEVIDGFQEHRRLDYCKKTISIPDLIMLSKILVSNALRFALTYFWKILLRVLTVLEPEPSGLEYFADVGECLTRLRFHALSASKLSPQNVSNKIDNNITNGI